MRRLALIGVLAVVALALSCRLAEASSISASRPTGDGRHAQVSGDPAASVASKVVTGRSGSSGVSPPSVVVFVLVLFALVATVLQGAPALRARRTHPARARPVQFC